MGLKKQAVSPNRHVPLHQSSSGFVLLHTLWLLLVASALISGLLILANQTSVNFSLTDLETRRELAQESAVELAIHDIVTRGARSRWLNPPTATEVVEIEGQRIALSVQNVAGLVDAGSSETTVLKTLLDGTLNRDGAIVLARIDAARSKRGTRPFSTYAELRAITQITDQEFGCLYQSITIFSGRLEPNTLLMPLSLAKLLHAKRYESQTASVMETSGSTAGATYRIEAVSVPTNDLDGQVLSIEVTIIGRHSPSHLIRSWLRLPQTVNSMSCS